MRADFEPKEAMYRMTELDRISFGCR